MQLKREVGEKGQVVIPKDIRDQLGIKPGSEVTFELKDDGIVMKPARTGKEFVEYFRSGPKLKKPMSIKDFKKTIDEQYEERHRHALR